MSNDNDNDNDNEPGPIIVRGVLDRFVSADELARLIAMGFMKPILHPETERHVP